MRKLTLLAALVLAVVLIAAVPVVAAPRHPRGVFDGRKRGAWPR